MDGLADCNAVGNVITRQDCCQELVDCASPRRFASKWSQRGNTEQRASGAFKHVQETLVGLAICSASFAWLSSPMFGELEESDSSRMRYGSASLAEPILSQPVMVVRRALDYQVSYRLLPQADDSPGLLHVHRPSYQIPPNLLFSLTCPSVAAWPLLTAPITSRCIRTFLFSSFPNALQCLIAEHRRFCYGVFSSARGVKPCHSRSFDQDRTVMKYRLGISCCAPLNLISKTALLCVLGR